MRKSPILAFILLTTVFAVGRAATPGSVRPVDLRCEYLVNPLGVDSLAPRLSWRVDAVDPAARGIAQSAYRLLVASSESALQLNKGDLWDSGKVVSDRSIQIPYAGTALTSGELAFWKVEVWDRDGKASAWSAPARWSMGLLAPSDWKAKWIGLEGGEGKPQEFVGSQWIGGGDPSSHQLYLRRDFEVAADNPTSSALTMLIATGSISFSINSKQVFESKEAKSPMIVDISPFIHAGRNVMAVSVTTSGDVSPALVGYIELNFADGVRNLIKTANDWRVSGQEVADWKKDSFDDSAWAAAKIIGPYGMKPWGELGWQWRPTLPARIVRKEFTRPASVKRATLYMSGLGLSEAYLNGQKVSADVLSPALSEYAKRVYYTTYDVTKLVRPGGNALGVILGNGRYFQPRHSGVIEQAGYGYPKLKLQLVMELADGKSEIVASDETWKVTTDGPIRANNEYDGEIYDARKEMPGWDRVGFNDSHWQSVEIVNGPTGVLSAQPIAPIRVTESLRAKSVKEVRPGVFVIDMGQNMVGWGRLTVSGPKGTKVVLRHAERLRPNGMIYTDNLRMAEATDTYILKGGGTEVYEPRFTYHGFRYVEVRGYPGKPTLATLLGREVRDDVERASDFSTSNPLLNKIYQAVLWGTKDNYRSIPTDCPQRDEREGWLGDRGEGSLGETYLFNVAAFYSKWMRDIYDARRDDGAISNVSPSYWQVYFDDVTWPSSYITITDHLYQQYGDVRVIEQNYPAMRKWVAHMRSYLKDGLMPRDYYGDWCVPPESPEMIYSQDPARQTDGTFVGTAYFYHVLQLLQKFATLIGKPEDVQDYAQLSEQMRVAFNQKFFHPATAQYSNGSNTSSLVALALGMVPEGERENVVKALVRKIAEHDKGHVATGLIGNQWLMQTLTETGHADIAYQIAAQSTYPGWGYMVTAGDATTIWELWNGDTANPAMNSGNHLMLVGDLIVWLYENVAGIRPDPLNPGFKHIIMRPTPVGDLTSAHASFNSSYGKVGSDWKVKGRTFEWNITVPANTTATVYVPAQDASTVTETGKPAGTARAIKYLRAESGAAVYEVGSGSYRFASALPK